MEQTFNQQICEIGHKATVFISESFKGRKAGIAIPRSEEFSVTAFDFEGEAYTTYARTIYASCIVNDEGNDIDYDDLSNQSCARIADYVKEHLKEK